MKEKEAQEGPIPVKIIKERPNTANSEKNASASQKKSAKADSKDCNGKGSYGLCAMRSQSTTREFAHSIAKNRQQG